MADNKIFKVSLSGLLAAIIAVFTAFVKINTGINNGYLHFGDSMIYLAGCLIGPYALLSSAIGGALADILSGSAIWAIPTAIIKIFNCLPFVLATSFYQKKKCKRKIVNTATVSMTILSAIITVLGYLLAESLMYSFASAVTSVPFSVFQGVGSAIIFVFVGLALDRINVYKYIAKR